MHRKQSEEERAKRSESAKKRWVNDPKRKKSQLCKCDCGGDTKPGRSFLTGHNRRGCRTNSHVGKVFHTKEWNENISKGQKANLELIERRREIARKMAEVSLKTSGKHPNKQEIVIDNCVQTACPKEFIYSGNGTIWIEGKNPDWFNVNGKKQVIEFFGDWYHSERKTGRAKEQEEELRKSHFARYGYQTLIIWGSELKNKGQIIDKIKEFSKGGN